MGQNHEINVMPIGSVVCWAGDGTKVPEGWFLCDGTAYSVSQYLALYEVIGGAFGTHGTEFRVPDCRGVFIRGVDGASNMDPDAATRTALYSGGNTGDNVGSFQGDQFGNHNHSIPNGVGNLNNCWKGGDCSGDVYLVAPVQSQTTNVGGSETRPKNIYMNYIIKYK